MFYLNNMIMNGNRYKIGEKYSYEMDFEFLTISAKGVIVYNNGQVAVARIWYGDFEVMAALEADDCTYTKAQITYMYPGFKDDHERKVQESYILIDLETDTLISVSDYDYGTEIGEYEETK